MKQIFIIILFSLFIIPCSLFAGPPFNTDDPEPVNFRHWEFYISSINTFMSGFSKGTLPHFEINYGVVPDVQFHCLIPIDYNYSQNSEATNRHSFDYSYGYTELGVKYRFVKEDENTPQIGTFPLVEVPTVYNNSFSNGLLQVYLPIWLQKSWGKFTTYGGGGYWFNPGTGNKNWVFAGLEAQYDLSKTFTPGCEIIYESASTTGSNSFLSANSIGGNPFFGINAGGFINFSEKFHFIFSAGHSLSGKSTTIAYGGFLWTI